MYVVRVVFCVLLYSFAGRLMSWHPSATESKRRALPAYAPNLLCRFLKESSLVKQHLFPDVDYVDLGVRNEELKLQGNPIMLQLGVVPAYALCIFSL